jgi:two-component system, LytTR family, response regulator LytT
MIKVLLIEDEILAAKRLRKLLTQLDRNIDVIQHCESIETTLAFLNTNPEIDLMLMDIKLGDGLSLEILKHVDIQTPIIFTTAFDEFTLKAFKLNSVDYLLKPVDVEELAHAFDKYENLYQKDTMGVDIHNLISKLAFPPYKERFLIKHGVQMVIVMSQDISYFYTEDGYTHLITTDGRKYIIDDTLDALQKELNPRYFFRINRSMLIKVDAIQRIEQYFNSRYSLQVIPPYKNEVLVSRERVREFKEWIGG